MPTITNASSGGAKKMVTPAIAPAQRKQQAARVMERSQEAVRESMKAIEALATRSHTSVEISVHPETGVFVIRVKNAETGEVVLEAPSEQALSAVATILRNAGLLLNETV